MPRRTRKMKTRRDYEELVGLIRKKRKQKGGSSRVNLNFIRKHIPFLAMISNKNANKVQRENLINNMNKGQMNAVRTMMKNFLNSKYPINDTILKKLAKDKDFIYHLASSGQFENKKKILNQKGGLLGALVPLASSLIAPVLGQIFK